MTMSTPQENNEVTEREDVIQTLSSYASAIDRRDGEAAAAALVKGALVEVYVRAVPEPRKVTEVMEHELVAYIIDKMLPMHLRGEFCRHLISNHIVEFNGEQARMDAQFVVVRATPEKPANALPMPAGPLGSVHILQSGSLRTELTKSAGRWLIQRHEVLNDLDWPGMPLS